ncbi:MAG: hypothetical protein J0L61_02160 [Planctomycetes bacterium]|nr:hypothetical protein [Planctomycetota bacterium]
MTSLARHALAALLTATVLAGGAQARPAPTPDDVYDRYETAFENQIDAADAKIERQSDRAEAQIDRLIDRGASDASIERAVSNAAAGLVRTIRSAGSALIRTTLATRRTMLRIQTAAERREDEATVSLCDEYIANLDDTVDNLETLVADAEEFLSLFRSDVLDAEDPAEAYEDATDELTANLEGFVDSLYESDNGPLDNSDDDSDDDAGDDDSDA